MLTILVRCLEVLKTPLLPSLEPDFRTSTVPVTLNCSARTLLSNSAFFIEHSDLFRKPQEWHSTGYLVAPVYQPILAIMCYDVKGLDRQAKRMGNRRSQPKHPLKVEQIRGICQRHFAATTKTCL
jgi:hypothetical protein